MFGLTISDAAKACGGTLVEVSAAKEELKRMIIDSRSARKGDLFVAYKGEKADGHDFVAAAFSAGASCALVSHIPENARGTMILVEDVQPAVEKIAAAFREKLSIPVVGIAGSVGKTTAKEMVSSVLSQRFSVYKTDQNLNNLIGVPVCLSRIEPNHEIAVLEMGISDFGEMRRLSAMTKPTCAVFTLIGHAHLEFLHDQQGVLQAKTEMLENMAPDATIFVNGDDPYLDSFACTQKKIRFGLGENCDVTASDVITNPDGTVSCTIHSATCSFPVTVPAVGLHMVMAALEGAAVGFYFGLTKDEIVRGIECYETVGRRLAMTETGLCRLLDDSYNANPDSTKSSLLSLSRMPGRKVAILGEMRELGENTRRMHQEVGAFAAQCGINLLIGIGELGKEIVAGARENHMEHADWFESNAKAIAKLPKFLQKGDSVLVKASRGSHLEEIAEAVKVLHQPIVFLDIDDTILDFKTAEETAVSETFRRLGVEPTKELLSRYSEINLSCWEALERGEMTRDEVKYGRFEMLFEEKGIPLSGKEAADLYEVLLGIGHWFMPGAEQLLKNLKGKVRLFLVSNGTAKTQDSRLASAGISGYFEGIFISQRVGFEKPYKAFFDAAFAEIPNFSKENSLIVGDSLTSDILGGKNAGIRTCWYNYRNRPPRDDICPDYTISDLSELPNLLKRIFF